MATKKDLVEAHAFSRRRLVTAFVSGEDLPRVRIGGRARVTTDARDDPGRDGAGSVRPAGRRRGPWPAILPDPCLRFALIGTGE